MRIDSGKTAQPPIILFSHSIVKLNVWIIPRYGLRKRPPERPVHWLRHEFTEFTKRLVLRRREIPRTLRLVENVHYGRRMAASERRRSQVLYIPTRFAVRYNSVIVNEQDISAADGRVQPSRDFVDGNVVDVLPHGSADSSGGRALFLSLDFADGAAKMLYAWTRRSVHGGTVPDTAATNIHH